MKKNNTGPFDFVQRTPQKMMTIQQNFEILLTFIAIFTLVPLVYDQRGRHDKLFLSIWSVLIITTYFIIWIDFYLNS